MLTKKQKEVLDFVNKYIKKMGYAPSLEDIQDKFKLASVSTAHYYIAKLKDGGYLEKQSNQPRSISVNDDRFTTYSFRGRKASDIISIPILGYASCGEANMFADENIEGYLALSKNIVSKKDGVFVLKADGDSMNKANIRGKSINHGDYVLIDSEDKSAGDGDYVLSVIDGNANLKKLKVKNGEVVLVPESDNKKHKPIYISNYDNFIINGKILAVVNK